MPAAADPDADLLQPVLGAERGEGRRGRQLKAGVGLLTEELSKSVRQLVAVRHRAAEAQHPVARSTASPVEIVVVVIAAVMVVLMTATQFITQLQIMSKNLSPETKASPMYRQQRILLYILPLVFVFSGFAFPLGVMFYWLTSNLWTMGQQFIVIRNMPTPGSEAAMAREARLAKRNRNRMSDDAAALAEAADDEPPEAGHHAASAAGRQEPTKKSGSNKR